MLEWIALAFYRLLTDFRKGCLLAFFSVYLLNFFNINQSWLNFAYILFLIVFLPYYGFLADKFGQRISIRVVELFLFVFLLIAYFFGLNPNLIFLILFGPLLRAMVPISQSPLAQSKRRGQFLGLLKSIGEIAVVSGLGFSLYYGETMILPALLVFSGASLLLSLFLPQTKILKRKTKIDAEIRRVFVLPVFVVLLWAGSGGMVEAAWLRHLAEAGGDYRAGLISSVIPFLVLAGYISTGFLLDRYGPHAAKIYALVDSVVLFLAPITNYWPVLFGFRILRTLPYSMQQVYVEKIPLDISNDHFGLAVGTTAALFLIAEAVFMFIGSIFTGLFGYRFVFWFAGAMALISFCFLRQRG